MIKLVTQKSLDKMKNTLRLSDERYWKFLRMIANANIVFNTPNHLKAFSEDTVDKINTNPNDVSYLELLTCFQSLKALDVYGR